jgi:hypothetical protein
VGAGESASTSANVLDVPPELPARVLSVTRARVGVAGLWTFYQQTRRVLKELPTQPGLLAHDVRLRWLDTHAWTYTLWLDYESLVEFRTGFTHTSAVMRAGGKLGGADFWLYACPADYTPANWKDIAQVLQEFWTPIRSSA